MIYLLGYGEAKRRHPVEVGALMERLRRSRSVEREAPAEVLEWVYRYNLPLRDDSPPGEVLLEAQIGRWRGREAVPLPAEIERRWREFRGPERD